MLNGLAIWLLLTTLATAGVFTPSPAKQKPQQNDVIVKEGHRAVMVEYETDGGSNTKVLISPEDPHLGVKEKISEKAESAKEKLKETVSFVLPNGVEEKDEKISHKTSTPRELVCDAFGKCKHKIASALGKTKEVEEGAKETVGNVKDIVSDKASEAKEKVEEVSVKAKEKVCGAKEDVMEKAQELKQGATEKLKKGAKDVVDSTKRVKEDVEQNVSVMTEATKRKGKEAEEKLKGMKEEGKKEMKDILHRGRGVIYDAFAYTFPKESIASSFRIMQLLGFSLAFGMAIWVTFISSYVLARVLPRQQFAMVQSKIYPLYFKAMSYSIGVALVAHMLNKRSRLYSSAPELLQGFGLLASLSMVLANLWYLEPRATKVMFERMKLEKEEARGLVDVSGSAEPPGSRVAAEPAVTITQATTPLTGMATTTTTATAPLKSTQKTGDASAAAMTELVRLSELLKKLNSLSSLLNVLTLIFLTFHLVHLGQGGLHSQLVC